MLRSIVLPPCASLWEGRITGSSGWTRNFLKSHLSRYPGVPGTNGGTRLYSHSTNPGRCAIVDEPLKTKKQHTHVVPSRFCIFAWHGTAGNTDRRESCEEKYICSEPSWPLYYESVWSNRHFSWRRHDRYLSQVQGQYEEAETSHSCITQKTSNRWSWPSQFSLL